MGDITIRRLYDASLFERSWTHRLKQRDISRLGIALAPVRRAKK
ncbi:MAG: hypothetical protein AAGD28_11160 [Bacteroidota bacterium]